MLSAAALDAAYVIDSTKARRELGWVPTISMETGLSEAVGWIKTNWDAIQKEELAYVHKA